MLKPFRSLFFPYSLSPTLFYFGKTSICAFFKPILNATTLRRLRRAPWPRRRNSSSSEWLVFSASLCSTLMWTGIVWHVPRRNAVDFYYTNAPRAHRRTHPDQDWTPPGCGGKTNRAASWWTLGEDTSIPPLTFEETVAAPLAALIELWFSWTIQMSERQQPPHRLSPQNWVTNVPNAGNKEYIGL